MNMEAIILPEYGDADVLSFETVEAPVPGEGEVLVKVRAVSVNRGFDVVARSGGSPFNLQLPLILGVDPTGDIVDVGEGIDRARIGETVFVSGVAGCRKCAACAERKPCQLAKRIGVTSPGGYAQYIAIPAFQARVLPEGVDPAEATVICRHAGAAFSEIHTADVKEGEWVLVMGAAGALGSFLIQLAKLRGAKVIAVASSADRLAACLSLGADDAVNYRAEALTERLMEITDGHGVDVVFENISDPELFPKAFASLADNGRLVSIGYHGGGTVPVDMKALHLKRLRILCSVMGGGSKDPVGECLNLARDGKLRSLIGVRLPLAKAAEGHRLVEEGKLIGKVILEPWAEG